MSAFSNGLVAQIRRVLFSNGTENDENEQPGDIVDSLAMHGAEVKVRRGQRQKLSTKDLSQNDGLSVLEQLDFNIGSNNSKARSGAKKETNTLGGTLGSLAGGPKQGTRRERHASEMGVLFNLGENDVKSYHPRSALMNLDSNHSTSNEPVKSSGSSQQRGHRKKEVVLDTLGSLACSSAPKMQSSEHESLRNETSVLATLGMTSTSRTVVRHYPSATNQIKERKSHHNERQDFVRKNASKTKEKSRKVARVTKVFRRVTFLEGDQAGLQSSQDDNVGVLGSLHAFSSFRTRSSSKSKRSRRQLRSRSKQAFSNSRSSKSSSVSSVLVCPQGQSARLIEIVSPSPSPKKPRKRQDKRATPAKLSKGFRPENSVGCLGDVSSEGVTEELCDDLSKKMSLSVESSKHSLPMQAVVESEIPMEVIETDPLKDANEVCITKQTEPTPSSVDVTDVSTQRDDVEPCALCASDRSNNRTSNDMSTTPIDPGEQTFQPGACVVEVEVLPPRFETTATGASPVLSRTASSEGLRRSSRPQIATNRLTINWEEKKQKKASFNGKPPLDVSTKASSKASRKIKSTNSLSVEDVRNSQRRSKTEARKPVDNPTGKPRTRKIRGTVCDKNKQVRRRGKLSSCPRRTGNNETQDEPTSINPSSQKAQSSKAVVGAKLKADGKGQIATHNGFHTSSSGYWTNRQISELKTAHQEVDPVSVTFWNDIASRLNGTSASECREKWFSLVKTPKVRQKKASQKGARGSLAAPSEECNNGNSALSESVSEEEDDIFNSTPLRGTLFPDDSNLLALSSEQQDFRSDFVSFDLGSPILQESKNMNHAGTEYDDQMSIQPVRPKIGYKTYLQGLKRGVSRATKEKIAMKQGQEKKPNCARILSETVENGEVELNALLTPGGTLRVKSLSEGDDNMMYLSGSECSEGDN